MAEMRLCSHVELSQKVNRMLYAIMDWVELGALRNILERCQIIQDLLRATINLMDLEF